MPPLSPPLPRLSGSSTRFAPPSSLWYVEMLVSDAAVEMDASVATLSSDELWRSPSSVGRGGGESSSSGAPGMGGGCGGGGGGCAMMARGEAETNAPCSAAGSYSCGRWREVRGGREGGRREGRAEGGAAPSASDPGEQVGGLVPLLGGSRCPAGARTLGSRGRASRSAGAEPGFAGGKDRRPGRAFNDGMRSCIYRPWPPTSVLAFKDAADSEKNECTQ